MSKLQGTELNKREGKLLSKYLWLKPKTNRYQLSEQTNKKKFVYKKIYHVCIMNIIL